MLGEGCEFTLDVAMTTGRIMLRLWRVMLTEAIWSGVVQMRSMDKTSFDCESLLEMQPNET